MIKLVDILKEILQEGNNPFGKIAYHGSPKLFDFNSLDITRVSLAKGVTGEFIEETASELSGVGLYITLDLWMNNPPEWYKQVINPVFDEGTKGSQSAQKYAGNVLPTYIYQVELADDINLEGYYYKDMDGRNLSKNQMDILLKEGIDGLYDGNVEAVIINKSKINSFKLVYKAEDYMTQIFQIDMTNINAWSDVSPHNYKIINQAIDQSTWVCFKKNELESYIKQILGNTYNEIYTYKGIKLYSNAPKEAMDFPKRYNIKDYKFISVSESLINNWVKA